jgi:hypothetical protein
MFVFFINAIFYSFCQNEKGQSFFDLTVKGLGLETSSVSLCFFQGLNDVPEFFRFEENGDLVIQQKQTTEGEIQEEILVDIQTIAVENYVLNGEKILPC